MNARNDLFAELLPAAYKPRKRWRPGDESGDLFSENESGRGEA